MTLLSLLAAWAASGLMPLGGPSAALTRVLTSVSLLIAAYVVLGAMGVSDAALPILGMAIAALVVAVLRARSLRAWSKDIAPALVAVGVTLGAGILLVRWVRLEGDTAWYHVPLVAPWLQFGTIGWVSSDWIALPFRPESYPLSGHVLLAISAQISGVTGIVTLTAAGIGLLLMASCSVSSEAGGGALKGAAAAAAVLSFPSVVRTAAGAPIDVLANAFLACEVGLAIALRSPARVRPGAVVLAGALAVGTKTSVLACAVLTAVIVVGPMRARWNRTDTVLATLGALTCCWFARNIVDHGSPLWPQLALPGGAAKPEYWQAVRSFAQIPADTLANGRLADMRSNIGLGSLLAILSVVVVAVRTPRLRPFAAVTVVGCVAWLAAPTTGLPDAAPTFLHDLWLGSSRYLSPAFVVAIVGLTTIPGRRMTALLVVIAALNLLELRSIPDELILIAAALACSAMLAALEPWSLRLAPVAAVLIVLVVPLGRDAGEEAWRSAAAASTRSSAPAWRAAVATNWARPTRPLASEVVLTGPLAGPYLRRELLRLPALSSCAQAARDLAEIDVVIYRSSASGRFLARCRAADPTTWRTRHVMLMPGAY